MRWWERQINTLMRTKQERTERKADMESTLFINGNIILQDGILEQGKLLVIGDRIQGIRPGEGERETSGNRDGMAGFGEGG